MESYRSKLRKRGITINMIATASGTSASTVSQILNEELTFTKLGWIYQYSQIPDNWDNKKTLYWMKKTYEHFYGELND